MKYFGRTAYILGIRIRRLKKRITLDQLHYIKNFLVEYNMNHSIPVSTPIGGHTALFSLSSMRLGLIEWSIKRWDIEGTCPEYAPTTEMITDLFTKLLTATASGNQGVRRDWQNGINGTYRACFRHAKGIT